MCYLIQLLPAFRNHRNSVTTLRSFISTLLSMLAATGVLPWWRTRDLDAITIHCFGGLLLRTGGVLVSRTYISRYLYFFNTACTCTYIVRLCLTLAAKPVCCCLLCNSPAKYFCRHKLLATKRMPLFLSL